MPYSATPKERKAKQRSYYRRNRKKRLAWNRQYYLRNQKRRCNKTKAWRTANKDRVRYTNKAGHLRRAYSLTPKQVEERRKSQNNLCSLCNKPFTKKNRPQVDHNHTTGQNRALLHGVCNRVLGVIEKAKKSGTLSNALDYLEKWEKYGTQIESTPDDGGSPTADSSIGGVAGEARNIGGISEGCDPSVSAEEPFYDSPVEGLGTGLSGL